MNILVTCGNSPIMNEVIMHIRKIQEVDKIILVDAEEICFNHNCDVTAIVPRGGDANYPDEIKTIVTQYDIQYIFICSDEEALALSRHDWAKKISHIDSFENVGLVLNKLKLHFVLVNKDVNVVPFFKGLSPQKMELDLLLSEYHSLILRPIYGRGSRGLVHIIPSKLKGEFPLGVTTNDFTLPSDSDNYFLTEYIPGNKYSADCMFVDGVLKSCMIRNNGESVKYKPPTMFAKTSSDTNIHEFAIHIGQLLYLNGFHQIECAKDHNGVVKLIEINPRLDATLPITACYSENFYELILKNKEKGLLEPEKQVFKRFYITNIK